MARQASRYVCQECGAVFPKWSGRCDACGEWNSIVEEQARPSAPRGLGAGQGTAIDFVPLAGSDADAPRLASGIAEFDRVTGGGLVGGSALLVGGDPGIGKSTMLLQVAGALARAVPAVYISGEEAVDQIRLRARRLGLGDAPVGLAAATSVRDIATTLESGEAPRAVVVDSIQTMYVDTLESAPGTVAQVRASAQELIQLAKRCGFCLLCWSDTSPRTDPSRVRGCSNTWSTACSISKAGAATSSACCAASRTASARPTRSACSR